MFLVDLVDQRSVFVSKVVARGVVNRRPNDQLTGVSVDVGIGIVVTRPVLG